MLAITQLIGWLNDWMTDWLSWTKSKQTEPNWNLNKQLTYKQIVVKQNMLNKMKCESIMCAKNHDNTQNRNIFKIQFSFVSLLRTCHWKPDAINLIFFFFYLQSKFGLLLCFFFLILFSKHFMLNSADELIHRHLSPLPSLSNTITIVRESSSIEIQMNSTIQIGSN